MQVERFWILWGKKQSDELEAGEEEELKRLMHEIPPAERTEEMIASIWQSTLKPYPADELPDGGWHMIAHKIAPEKNRGIAGRLAILRGLKKMSVAAVVLLTAGITYLIYHYQSGQGSEGFSSKMMNKVITRPDSKSQIELPDGTTVWLNKRSKLTYSNDFFGEKHREVTLVGEAFFDVRKNAAVPFIINANDIRITVKGTAFNVKAYPESKKVETSLVRGLIEITTKKDPERKILLKPNEKFTISVNPDPETTGSMNQRPDGGSAFHSYTVTPLKIAPGIEPAETAWMNQRLAFNNEAFEELAPKLESWYNLRVSFKTDQLKKIRFTGVVEKESIDELMKVLQASSGFRYKITGDQLTLER